jgi:hypothetical protein
MAKPHHVLAALAFAAQLANAQAKQPTADSLHRRTTDVASKFEEFSGRPGALYTRTIERIGQIRAEGFRDVNVSVATVTDAGAGGTPFSALLLGIGIRDPGYLGVVDSDELPSFASALALMERRAPELAAALHRTDAVYVARTGLKLIVTGQGKAQRLYISSAHYWIEDVEFEIADVARFRALVDSALTTLKH